MTGNIYGDQYPCHEVYLHLLTLAGANQKQSSVKLATFYRELLAQPITETYTLKIETFEVLCVTSFLKKSPQTHKQEGYLGKKNPRMTIKRIEISLI